MSDMSDYLEDELLDHALGTGAFSMPSTIALALFTDATSDAGGGTEVANSNAYARLEVQGSTGLTFAASSGGTTDNDQDWDFTTASGSWGTVTNTAIVDNTTHGAGNFLFHGALSASKAVGDGDTFRFAAGDLDVTLQ